MTASISLNDYKTEWIAAISFWQQWAEKDWTESGQVMFFVYIKQLLAFHSIKYYVLTIFIYIFKRFAD